MALTGNIGEWSEIYTFFRLLAEGELYSADGQLKRINDLRYPIKKVFRDDAPDRVEYTIDSVRKHVIIASSSKTIQLPQSEFAQAAKLFLEKIQVRKGKSGAFEFPEIEAWMRKVLVDKVAAKSQDKADIRLIIHNFQTGVEAELGYSIKSRLGGRSTLLNSNKDKSNFLYLVNGVNSDFLKQYQELLSKEKKNRVQDKIQMANRLGGTVTSVGPCSKALQANLLMLDMGMPKVISELLLLYYSTGINNISVLTQMVKKHDPLQLGEIRNQQPIYEYKIKQFLLAFALGMTVSTPWNGSFNANGGYIIVKEDGDVVCYHFFDRQQLEDYLFFNTAFDTPSTSRHEFGDFFEMNGSYYIKLNIQVRFIL